MFQCRAVVYMSYSKAGIDSVEQALQQENIRYRKRKRRRSRYMEEEERAAMISVDMMVKEKAERIIEAAEL